MREKTMLPRVAGVIPRARWRSRLGFVVAGCVALIAPGEGLSLDAAQSVSHYNCRNWTRQNGLPVNGINAIAQTRDGFLWLGTHAGLVRFDGTRFDMVGLPDRRELRNRVVRCLAPDTGSALWFGLESHGYGRFDGHDGWTFGRGLDGGMDWGVRAILPIQGEEAPELLVAGSGLTGWRMPRGDIQPAFDGTDPDAPHHVSAAYADSRGRILLGTAGGGLYTLQDGVLAEIPDPRLDDVILYAIAEDRQGTLWFGTSAGLLAYDADFQPQDVAFPQNQVNALLADRHGALWVGTTDSGLLRWIDGRLEFLRQADGLVGDSVLSLAEDAEGSLWVGCREGLTQISDVKFQTLAAREGLPAHGILSVIPSPRGGLWVAGAQGTTYLSSWGQWFHAEPGPRQAYTKRVFETGNGDLYAVSGRNEIEIYAGGQRIARHPTPEMPVAMTEDDEGVVVSVGGSLYRADRNGIRPHPFADGLEPPMYWIVNLMTARDGAVWAASVNGVFRIRDGRFRQWTVDDGTGSDSVRHLAEDQDGAVWAATHAGIWRIRDNQLQAIGRDQGLYDANLYTVIPDTRGNLWVDSSRGIFRVRLQDLHAVADNTATHVPCEAFDDPNSIRAADRYDQEQAACRTDDGIVWFPAQNGVIMIDPANVSSNPVPPQVAVRHVHFDGKNVPVTRRIHLPPGRGDLEIEYTALTFLAPHRARFRYRLEGFDPDWVNAEDRRLAYYARLRPGPYTFSVAACNADGVWSTSPASLEIVLTPHMAQTLWFRALAGILAGAGVAGTVTAKVRGVRSHQRRLQQANELLESKVVARTRELAEQRNMLRALIDNLPDNVFIKDMDSRVVLNNVAHARMLGAATPEETIGKSDLDYFPAERARKYFDDEQTLLREGIPYDGEETAQNLSTGQSRWIRTTKVPLRDASGRTIGLAGINRDITERKEWEARLEKMHAQLMEVSRQAGMAEVATSVLHNVGNVLNSVNTSAGIIAERLQHSRITGIEKLISLLRQHNGDLAAFLAQPGRADQVLDYLSSLAKHLRTEHAGLRREVEELSGNIEHIKDIVVMQQSYAKVSGIVETVSAEALVEDAIRMNNGALTRHGVDLVREYEPTPPVTLEKHKVLQILVNVIRNAKYACDESGRPDKRIAIRLRATADRVCIEVTDNGVGIPQENLTRIFHHGFTTRANGHGFGLHSGSLAAQELGGELTAQSPGPGQGATFTLALPLQRERDST
jgi:PAS domain S-box-containing protein